MVNLGQEKARHVKLSTLVFNGNIVLELQLNTC